MQNLYHCLSTSFTVLEVLMPLIREIAQQALSTNLLTLEAEEHLRQLLQTKYEEEDFYAFMKLQHAVMTGSVVQESRLLSTLERQYLSTSR
jgi:hypothetical protein